MTTSINSVKKTFCKSVTLGLLMLLSSCSLMKFTIKSKDDPLPKNLLNMRIAVRVFQSEFASGIIAVSDTIIAHTEDTEVKLNAIAFKNGIAAASVKTAFQSVPELALVDTWVLCTQFTDVMNTDFGKAYMGSEYTLVQYQAKALKNRIAQIARTLLKAERFNDLQSFVHQYAADNPATSFDFPRTNILSPLAQYLGVPDSVYVKTIGSGANALTDIGDKIGITSELLGRQLRWEKDKLTLEWLRDSPTDDFLVRADSLNRFLEKMAYIAEESPELIDGMAANMRIELMPLIQELNGGMDATFYKLADERLKMETYIDEQRKLLVSDVNATGEQMIDSGAKSMTSLIKEVAWIVVLAAIILIILLFAIPFMSGYYLAKARFKTNDTSK